MKRAFYLIVVLTVLLQSCKGQNMDIDNVIEKYSNTDFDNLKGLSIYFRSKGHQRNTSIYFVNEFKGSCSPYTVEFNDNDKTVVEIKNHLVLSSCGKDYLSKEQIETALHYFIGYKLCLVQVDTEGNVYINPDKQELPTLLRKSPNATPKDLHLFKLYKEDWYVRK